MKLSTELKNYEGESIPRDGTDKYLTLKSIIIQAFSASYSDEKEIGDSVRKFRHKLGKKVGRCKADEDIIFTSEEQDSITAIVKKGWSHNNMILAQFMEMFEELNKQPKLADEENVNQIEAA